MKKIWAYGDSFVAGDQDIPGRVDAIEENSNYNRYNISFVSHLAKKLEVELTNRAISGCSNFVQLDRLWMDAPDIKNTDIVIFGLTTSWRDRFTLPHTCKEYFLDTRGPSILDRGLASNPHKIPLVDLFYVLSSIEKIEKVYNLKVVKLNLFHDTILEASEAEKKIFDFENFIGLGVSGNTLMEVLTENWGNSKKIIDHSKWSPSKEHRHLFTRFSHPSIEGHKLIADWLEKELIKMGII
jgi:hypothetical protein